MKVSKGSTRAANPLRIVADGRDDSPAVSAAPEGNLPPVLTSFVGRGRELSEVEGLLAETRLLTLTGPGGCGKTRLALRVATGLRDSKSHGQSSRDGIWWVGLSSLPDAGLVPNAVASALGVSEAPDRTLTETLAALLEAKDLVLVLDNCEHLVDACAELTDTLLRSCPGMKVLATSREPLGVAGEVSWPMPPLSLPESKQGQAPEDLLRSESVRLLVERARAGAPNFVLTEGNAPAVAALCRRLDGMPLAIELAASRVKVLSPEQILHRLDDRFQLLRGGRASIERHRTLRATIDWSHGLLSEEEKVVFRRLSVFTGGFTLVAAEEVCAGGVIKESEVLELLSCLVDKSLVMVVMASHGGPAHEARYRMLQTIRQYSSEELEGSEEMKDVRRRHADFFLDLAEEAEPAMVGPEQAAWLERLEREHDNTRVALGWLREEREAERGLRLAAALARFWWFRGHLAEGRAQLEGLLELCSVLPVSEAVRAKALHTLGSNQYADYTEARWTVARSRLEEALEIYRRLGHEPRVATVLQNIGGVSATLGEWTAAHSSLEESLEIVRRLDDRSGIALSHFYLGTLHLLRGDLSPARAHLEEGLGIFRALDDKFWINGCLVYLGYVDCEEGHHATARSRFVEMNQILPLVQTPWGSPYWLEGFARLASAEGHPKRALRLGGATAALRRTYGMSIGLAEQAAFERGLERAWQALGEEQGKAAWKEGRAMTLEEALAFALEDSVEESAAKPETKPDQTSGDLLTVLTTKLYVPQPRPHAVLRPRLIRRLDEGLHGKLTLVSAPAGFGKTTLLSEWLSGLEYPAAWLSLDEGDNDPTRFLTHLIAALQTVASDVGEGVLGMLQSPQPPPTEVILTALINEIVPVSDPLVLILDDYHLIDAEPVDSALAFLIEHLPTHLHLVIATREDPNLPLARLRARNQLTELRAVHLRFMPEEAAEFLGGVMDLNLSAEEISALEERTEGWIAGLQMAALSMQGRADTAGFVQAFTGSHRFVLDYLVEEVLRQQPDRIRSFLLRTSILDRMCGPLCDAVLLEPSASGQETMGYLERANLFLVPLDDERYWYRYHHLFAELLRQRLLGTSSFAGDRVSAAELHTRASQWYEDNGLEIEAFRHAAAANDVDRAARLIEGEGIPRHFRGAVITILDWLESLPKTVMDARPSLWWRHAALLLINGHTTGVEEKLRAAEDALKGAAANNETQDLVGRIAAARATLALTRYEVETVLVQSRRALEHLRPDNLFTRSSANWTLGVAYRFKGERASATEAFTEAASLSRESGDVFTTILATTGLGSIQEADNRLHLAAETYRRVLGLTGDQPLQIIYDAHLGLARVLYEWNDLAAAEQHGRQSLDLARQFESVIDEFIVCEVFVARLRLARGDVADAATILAQASRSAHQRNFVFGLPEVAGAQVQTLLRQGDLAAATRLAEAHEIPASQARVQMARGDASAALATLEPLRRRAEERGWEDERLKAMVLQTVAHYEHGEKDEAVQLLKEALVLAEPDGFVRTFVDEGRPMARLLSEAVAHGIMPDYTGRLLAAFEAEEQKSEDESHLPPAQYLAESLSQRELEVLRLVGQGLSNRQVGERLFLALDTVKGHNRSIFGKLQVHSRTEAIARARELGLL